MELMFLIFYALIFTFGICWGSFLNVWVYRIPIGKSIAKGRSFCPQCDTTLRTVDLVPLFSWLFLKGKCRYCKCKIPFQYPAFELLFGIWFVFIYFFCNLNPVAWFFSVFIVTVSCVMAKIDWNTSLIPDKLTYPSVVIAIIYVLTSNFGVDTGFFNAPTILDALIGGIGFYVFFLILHKLSNGGIGMGDAKWSLFLGIMLGWKYAFVALFIGTFASVIFSLTICLLFNKKIKELSNIQVSAKDEEDEPIYEKIWGVSLINGKPAVVMGPFLAFGTLIAWFYGETILRFFM